MCCPPKYRKIGEFFRYYNGEKTAPIPTIFVGGNHESGIYNRELYYGGWAAKNIYFMGLSNVIWFKGLRIAGISGIDNEVNFKRGYFENFPFDPIERFKSLHQTRIFEIQKLCLLKQPLDIFVSHDWPSKIAKLGDTKALINVKPWFKSDIEHNKLGSKHLDTALLKLRPKFWFSAHLHVRFKVNISWDQYFRDLAISSNTSHLMPQRNHYGSAAESFNIITKNDDEINLEFDSNESVQGYSPKKSYHSFNPLNSEEIRLSDSDSAPINSEEIPISDSDSNSIDLENNSINPGNYNSSLSNSNKRLKVGPQTLQDTTSPQNPDGISQPFPEIFKEHFITNQTTGAESNAKENSNSIKLDIQKNDISNKRIESSFNFAENSSTTFLALDKCLPRRHFLEYFDFEVPAEISSGFQYDPEWIAILKSTQSLIPKTKFVEDSTLNFFSNPSSQLKSEIEKNRLELLNSIDSWDIPENFVKTAPPAISGTSIRAQYPSRGLKENAINHINPQTIAFCSKFDIPNIL
ncbi:Lariat debranching enzyme [Smittium mucronatum]|uniref:Lariat debranching enzyme n=1 Tax=Smittium mucronatum TaxID=133383 RepID=A0A1R0GS31_9FUNG|nr:Lariat debranching enzyme [Smittium mucronatum]